jgi:uncharacterized membrane protein
MRTTTGTALALGAAGVAAGLLGARALRARKAGAAQQLADGRRAILRGVTVNRSSKEVYDFWRDLPNLARVVDEVIRVEPLDDRRSRWTVQAPGGNELTFVAEIVVDEPGEVLAWRSDESPVGHEGRVEFLPAPGDRGTDLRVGITYRPPAGRFGVAMAKIAGQEPDQQLRDALRRVKQIMEAGEVVLVDGQTSGRSPGQEKATQAIRHRVTAGGRP